MSTDLRRVGHLWGALLGLSVGATGCYSKATGYGGKITFAYASGVEVENFVKPIAPGARLDVVAFANGTEDKLVITAASSSAPRVLRIESIGERGVVLLAREPGVADIQITARDPAGNALVDKMFFHVARPASHGIEHGCTEDRDAAYVVGDDVDIFHRLKTGDGRPVVGHGYVPLRVAPESALELVRQPQGGSVYTFRSPRATPRVTVRSTVDGGELSLRLVDRGELKEAALECFGDCRLVEGQSEYVVARTRLGETPVCSQSALTRAKSLTPEICSVTAKLDDGTEDENREQLAVVKGLKFGRCRFEITLPELDGGRGIRLEGRADIGRVEFPGEGGGSGGGEGRGAPPGGSRGGWGLLRGAPFAFSVAASWFVQTLIALVYALVVGARRLGRALGAWLGER